ncbi:hypothetical protein NYZ00_18465 [Acinetobacter baumannii]|nr:hypothetical protein [Acinetobacter baumannii]
MKKYVFWGLVMSLLSACSNNVLNAEAPRAAQGQQDLESRPLVLSTSKEWDPSFVMCAEKTGGFNLVN